VCQHRCFAPLFGLLPIRLDNRYNHQLAFNFGDASLFDDMKSLDLGASLGACGVEDMAEVVGQAEVPFIERLETAAGLCAHSD
jgi:hypothetical protein